MTTKIEPRLIILEAVKNYLDYEIFNRLQHELYYNYNRRDFEFIKTIQKYFDFNSFNKNPKNPEDAWLFNYLMYETKRSKNQNSLKIGEQIYFVGNLPKRGLIVRYKNFLESIPNRIPFKFNITNASTKIF